MVIVNKSEAQNNYQWKLRMSNLHVRGIYTYLIGGTAAGSAETGVNTGETCRFSTFNSSPSVDLF